MQASISFILFSENYFCIKTVAGCQHSQYVKYCYSCSAQRVRTDIYTDLNDVFVGATLLRIAVFSILEQNSVHVRARVLEQLVGTVEHDQRDLTVAQNTQFVRFLHQSKLPLGECHLRDKKALF